MFGVSQCGGLANVGSEHMCEHEPYHQTKTKQRQKSLTLRDRCNNFPRINVLSQFRRKFSNYYCCILTVPTATPIFCILAVSSMYCCCTGMP